MSGGTFESYARSEAGAWASGRRCALGDLELVVAVGPFDERRGRIQAHSHGQQRFGPGAHAGYGRPPSLHSSRELLQGM